MSDFVQINRYNRVASATATLDSIAPLANEPLAYHAVAAPNNLVAGPARCSRDCDLGLVLPVARVAAQPRNGVLLFWGFTYTTMGYGDVVLAKPGRLLAPVEDLMGVSHVRFVHRLLLRRRDFHLSVADAEIHRASASEG